MKRSTNLFMPPKKKELLMPIDGWQENAYYIADVSMNRSNPIFRALMFTGFLHDGVPAGYSHVLGPSHDKILIRDLHYLKPRTLIAYIGKDHELLAATPRHLDIVTWKEMMKEKSLEDKYDDLEGWT
jgi:hypothetical protein